MNKTYVDILDMIASKSEERERLIADAEKMIEDAHRKIKEAKERSAAAVLAANVDEYANCQSEISVSQTAIKMYEERLKVLERQALISEEEAAAALIQINDRQREVYEKMIESLRKQLLLFDEVTGEHLNDIEEGNNVINQLHAIVPFRKMIGHNGSEPIFQEASPVFSAHYGVLNFSNTVKNSHVYKEITGKEPHKVGTGKRVFEG